LDVGPRPSGSREQGAGREKREERVPEPGVSNSLGVPRLDNRLGRGKETNTLVPERPLATAVPGRHGNPLRLGTAALRPNPGKSR